MRRRWLLALFAVFLAIAVTGSSGAADPAPGKPGKVESSPKASCSDSEKVSSAKQGEPQPEIGPVCFVNICKVDGGVLYHCVANVCDDCCRYDTQLDCTPDPTCSYNVPPYCQSPANCPPNACKRTCGGSSCGPKICH